MRWLINKKNKSTLVNYLVFASVRTLYLYLKWLKKGYQTFFVEIFASFYSPFVYRVDGKCFHLICFLYLRNSLFHMDDVTDSFHITDQNSIYRYVYLVLLLSLLCSHDRLFVFILKSTILF